jgi:hypothetical protein
MLFTAFALLLVTSASFGVATSPPSSAAPQASPGIATPATIRAIVVGSWGYGSGDLVWDYLNANWSLYGSVPIFIDSSTLHVVPSFTLSDLQNSGADVVIVSDPAGGVRQWTAAEASALAAYAAQGHPLIGTFLLLQYATFDNRILAPLWGLRSDLAYRPIEAPSATTADILSPGDCLFTRIENPLNQGGYPYVQVPLDGSWDPSDLAGATFLARSQDGRNVVTFYSSASIRATYISYMPEYQNGSQFDATQYLYNAIVCPFPVTQVASSSWGRIKTLYR